MKALLPILFFSILLFNGCGDDDDGSNCEADPQHDMRLLADYSNQVGQGPMLTFDEAASSEAINIDSDPAVEMLPDGRIELVYSGVTFKDGKTVYAVDELISQRKAEECWIIDSENSFSYDLSKSLDIVFVLDVSSSLGTNIEQIKDNAKMIVSDILSSNPEAKISVIKFSRGAVIEPLTSSESQLLDFIDENSIFDSPDIGSYEIEGRNETALYESINTAINLLSASGADGKGILTFTDGVSNFQFDPQFQDATEVIMSLNDQEISHYTIGYEGNQNTVDKAILEDLAVNGDFSFPQNLTELEEVFVRFSNSVATVYDLRYNTNNALLESPIEHRFLFSTTIVSE